jgi:LysR family transcriptional regulator, nitrogen assimilation regulatory protein
MEARQLRQFVAIVEEGSFSAAAERVGVAQPSLSHMVRLLELRLGVDLLIRIPRGITPTEAGFTLLRHARKILDATNEAIEQVRLTGTESVGAVSVGLPSSVSMVLSVPLAETVRVALPKVSLRVAESMSGVIRGWIDEHSIDLGILYDADVARNYDAQLLMTENLCFYSAPDAWPFPSPPDRPISLSEVARTELILPSPAHGLRVMIDQYARESSIRLNVVLEMDALPQIKALVSRGIGYTILASAAAQDFVDLGALVSVPIISPVLRRPAYLVRPSSRPQTRASKEVERLVERVVVELVREGRWTAELSPQLAAV